MIVLARRQLGSDGGEYFSSLLGCAKCGTLLSTVCWAAEISDLCCVRSAVDKSPSGAKGTRTPTMILTVPFIAETCLSWLTTWDDATFLKSATVELAGFPRKARSVASAFPPMQLKNSRSDIFLAGAMNLI